MKRFIICFLMSSLVFSMYAQEEDFSRLIRKGMELHDRGYFEAAIKCYQEGLLIYPESITAYYHLAQSYACLENHNDSKKCSEKAFMLEMDKEPTDKVNYYLEALKKYVIQKMEERKAHEIEVVVILEE